MMHSRRENHSSASRRNSVADTFLERAAVLFNYGAVLSAIAASQSFLTDDETKTAAKLFQQSADSRPDRIFYMEASKLMDISKSYWKKEWLNVISGKALGFQAIAELHQAQYHERIPDFFTLPALPRAVLAKPTPVEKQLFPGFKDVFAAVVPETTVVALKKFDKLKAERLQRLKDRPFRANGADGWVSFGESTL
ncbi:hypothetical protein OSTOST_13467 [Ostertagia ostertagi]